MQLFTQNASGTVELQVEAGSNHCSITEPTIKVQYKISIMFDVTALDDQGFLVDSLTFGAYFTALSSWPINYSCEFLAMKIGKDFIKMLTNRKEHVQGIEVTISPFPGVNVQYKAMRD